MKIWASPRPATSSASVATMGCTPAKATRLPLTSPARMPTNSESPMATGQP